MIHDPGDCPQCVWEEFLYGPARRSALNRAYRRRQLARRRRRRNS